jgi:ribosomal protein L40E
METQKCSKCGTDLDIGAEFCPKCGTKVTLQEKKKLSKKQIVVGFSTLVAAILIGGGIFTGVTIYNLPINQFKRAFNDDRWEVVIPLYTENKSDSKFDAQANVVLTDFIADTVNRYIGEDTTYEDATARLALANPIISTEESADLLRRISASRESYTAAEDAVQANDYYKALTAFSRVIEDDPSYFNKAQEAITANTALLCQAELDKANGYLSKNVFDKAISVLERVVKAGYADDVVNAALVNAKAKLSENIRNTAISEADNIASKGDNFKAFERLKKVASTDRDDSFNNKLDDYKAKSVSDATTKANELNASSDYVGAYKYLAALSNDIKTNDLTALQNSIAANYKTIVVSKAESEAKAGNFDAAISTLESAHSNISSLTFTSEINGYKIQKKEAVLKKAKSGITVNYDSIAKQYLIAPKGLSTSTTAISTSRNLHPLIFASSNYAGFMMDVGFRNGDWIFFEKITFDCDGKQFSFTIDYFDRNTQVIYGGGILERVSLTHTDSSYSSSTTQHNLSKLMEAMRSAKTIKIRFSGDRYHLDKSVSSSQAKQTVDMWDLYLILKDSPSSISSLT